MHNKVKNVKEVIKARQFRIRLLYMIATVLYSVSFVRLVKAFLFFIIVLTGLSCGLQIGEKVSPWNIEGFSVGCLNGMNEKVDLYFKGQLDTDQTNQVFDCTKSALILFKDRVRGNKKGEFTPNELRKFIHDLFLQDRVISNLLLTQLVRLKTVIIGGSEDKLTISDIERFIIFVDVLKKEAAFFQPYIQAFNFPSHQPSSINGSSLNTIEEHFKKSIDRLSVFLEQFSNPYLFADMKVLIQELNFFFGRQNGISHLSEKINLAGALKKFIVGGSDLVIQPNEWKDLILGYSYLIAARVNYTLLKKHGEFISPKGMQYISMTLNDLMDFAFLSIKNHPNNRIDKSDFLHLVTHLQSAKLIPEKLEKEAIHNFLLIIFGKVFNVEKSRYGIIELTFDQLKKIRKTVQFWNNMQSFLNSVPRSRFLQKDIVNSKQMPSFFSTKEEILTGKNIINQLFLLKPLHQKGRKVYLSGDLYKEDGSKYTIDYKNLTIYNFYHIISTMMKLGYEKNYPESSGMTQAELINFFNDFDIIGENMGWFQKKKNDALVNGEAEFMAANILTPTAKGFNPDWKQEELLTSNEIIEYLAYAVSFGFSVQEMDKIFLKICGEESVSRASGTPQKESQYDIDCIRSYLISTLKRSMDNMPDLQKALSEMDEEKKSQFVESLVLIAFETKKEYEEATYLTTNHLKNIVMALYFVETTINRYDLNGDSILQNNEIWLGFPTFQGYLSRILIHLLCKKSDDLAASVYAYTIQNEKLPASDELSDFERLVAWLQLQTHSFLYNVDVDLWDLYLDREKLTNVFSTIIRGFLAKKKEKGAKKACSNMEAAASPIIMEDTVYDYITISP